MSKYNISAEKKVEAVKAYLNGEGSYPSIARRFKVSESSVEEWVLRYKTDGILAFKAQNNNTVYSTELKLKAVQGYLSGAGSYKAIAAKFELRSNTQLRQWVKMYHSGKDFGRKMSGGSRMKKKRRTTYEERITIVKDCVENGRNFGKTAQKYNVSYEQVYPWVKRFSELGESSLEDHREKRIEKQEARTELEEMKVKMAQLEHELYMTRMERDLLKKTRRNREEGCFSQVRKSQVYRTIRECAEEFWYPVDQACRILKVSRSAYYKWLNGPKSSREAENERIADLVEEIHSESPDKGYRRIRDDLEKYYDTKISDKGTRTRTL